MKNFLSKILTICQSFDFPKSIFKFKIYCMEKLFFTILIIHCPVLSANAQPQWVFYNPTNSGLPGWTVPEMVIDSTNTKWFATDEGLARFQGNTWTVWDTTNSPIPYHFIQSIVKDKENKIWIATRNKGILKFDGINWTLYYNTNLGYPLIEITRLGIDQNNTLWACSQSLGLLKKINGENNWIRYYTGNSGIPDNSVTDVKFEGNIKWIGTVQGGIARFNDTSWTVYNHYNTPLESDFIERVGIDNFNNKWFCTRFGGVAKFNSNQNQWTIYNSTNSGLPWNNTYAIFIDDVNTKWIGIQDGGFVTFNDTVWNVLMAGTSTVFDFKKDIHGNVWICEAGVRVYNPNGVVYVKKDFKVIPENFIMLNSYPNPFNSKAKINISISQKGFVKLEIYAVNGKLVDILENNIKNKGDYKYLFDANNLSSGIYFVVLKTQDKIKVYKIVLLK
jgi:ligand-binding sensor domain-containing protein